MGVIASARRGPSRAKLLSFDSMCVMLTRCLRSCRIKCSASCAVRSAMMRVRLIEAGLRTLRISKGAYLTGQVGREASLAPPMTWRLDRLPNTPMQQSHRSTKRSGGGGDLSTTTFLTTMTTCCMTRSQMASSTARKLACADRGTGQGCRRPCVPEGLHDCGMTRWSPIATCRRKRIFEVSQHERNVAGEPRAA